MNTPDTPRDETTPLDPVTDPTSEPTGAHGDSLADEVFEDDTRAEPATAGTTADRGTTWASAPTGTSTATATRPPEAAPAPPVREYVKGPAPFAIVLGLLGLVVAASTLFTEVVGIDVPWGDLGPWTVVGAGVLVLLVGGLGLRASRGHD
jgi:hypothetical protein